MCSHYIIVHLHNKNQRKIYVHDDIVEHMMSFKNNKIVHVHSKTYNIISYINIIMHMIRNRYVNLTVMTDDDIRKILKMMIHLNVHYRCYDPLITLQNTKRMMKYLNIIKTDTDDSDDRLKYLMNKQKMSNTVIEYILNYVSFIKYAYISDIISSSEYESLREHIIKTNNNLLTYSFGKRLCVSYMILMLINNSLTLSS